MKIARVRSKMSSSGVAKIRRDNYWTKGGFFSPSNYRKSLNEAKSKYGSLCMHPGCTEKAVEDHHIRKLRDGGTNSIMNRIRLCKLHHDERHTHLKRKRLIL